MIDAVNPSTDEPAAITLADGSTLRVVRMSTQLAEELPRFHDRLSPDTVRNRFFSVHPHLSPGEVARFTDVDHLHREALVALDGDEIVAVARFDRLPPDETAAEVAFVVADAWQGRGVASALFTRLLERARELGVERFIAITMATNQRMRGVFRHAALPCHERYDGGVVTITMDVSSRGDVTEDDRPGNARPVTPDR